MHTGNRVSPAIVIRAFAFAVAAASAASTRGAAPDGETPLRDRLAWQIALERVGFSPGIIDGQTGARTQFATREFQRVKGLPMTGRLDDETAALLGVDADGAVTSYVVRAADIAQVGTVPKNWEAKSRMKRLDFESLDAALAEKFHCSRGLLAQLNPRRNLAELRPGQNIRVPAVNTPASARGDCIDIDLPQKVIRVLDGARRLTGLFHCSIAKDKSKLPAGVARVAVISEEPTYVFDPAMWPEVKGIDRKLLIPPGPRNPVGLCWIGLSLPGYGVHGTPNPELIGKTGSHGCFRLTNWDALRLGRMVRVGTPVRFLAEPAVVLTDR